MLHNFRNGGKCQHCDGDVDDAELPINCDGQKRTVAIPAPMDATRRGRIEAKFKEKRAQLDALEQQAGKLWTELMQLRYALELDDESKRHAATAAAELITALVSDLPDTLPSRGSAILPPGKMFGGDHGA